MDKTTIDNKVALKRDALTHASTKDIELYLKKVSETVEVLNAYKDLAVSILDGRVEIAGTDDILSLYRRVAETRAQIEPSLMNEGQIAQAVQFAHKEVDVGGWTKFMTVTNAKKVFGKTEAEAIIYNKPIKAQFKLRED